MRRFLGSKIRDIRVTGTHLEYEGSIALDEDYIDRAGILPNEEVQVLDLENGARFTTYVIKATRGSATVDVNGPAALLVTQGDRVMVLSYVALNENEISGHAPRIVSINPDS
ncbi:MAG: aspartate 1-decarboxylase [Chitinivibrionales bacterium]|nr:aspartate 1-decarboxylase [Chitinivibrionales bacterium]MBD3396030.1 aspartate 1-decarboxylase [Chitinivibrionales bacterium]